MEHKKSENNKFGLKFLILTSLITLLLFLVFLGAFWYFLSFVFTPEIKFVKQLPSNEDFICQQKIIGKISRHVFKRKFQIQELKLSKAEVDSLLRLTNVLVKEEQQGIFNINALNLQYPTSNTLELTLTINTKQTFIHGGFIYLRVTASPSYVGGKLSLNIKKVIANKIELPKFLIAKIEKFLTDKICKQESFNLYTNIFTEVRIVQDNKIAIKYYPIKLLFLLTNSR